MNETTPKSFEIHPGPTSTGNSLKRLLAGLAIIGIGAGGWWYWSSPPPAQPQQSAAVAPTVPVIAGTATTMNLPVWLSGIGTVTPLSQVDVKVRVDGQLQTLFFTEGQTVTAGQLLAQIDPRPYQATLAQAEATRARDMAQRANATQEVARAEKLAKAGAGTSQNLDAVRAQEASLKATIEADEAAIDEAELNLGFTRVTSPIAGRVGLRQVDAGSIVHAADTRGLVTVTQMAPISVLSPCRRMIWPRSSPGSAWGRWRSRSIPAMAASTSPMAA